MVITYRGDWRIDRAENGLHYPGRPWMYWNDNWEGERCFTASEAECRAEIDERLHDDVAAAGRLTPDVRR